MKLIETGLQVDGKELKLHPVDVKGEILLYDIYLGEAIPKNWCGSRSTVNAVGMFLGLPDLVKRLWG